MDRLPGGRLESTTGQRQAGLKREPIRIGQPCISILEVHRLLASNPIAPRQTHPPRLATE